MTKGLIRNQHVSDTKKERARELRRTMTEAETVFWRMVRNRRLKNLKFRRQQVISGFIIDFYCEELRLCVEIDGNVHRDILQKAYDMERDSILSQQGLNILRIENHDVIHNPEKVKKLIGG